VGNSAIYVQARGNILRDLRYELSANGFEGKDLTVFAAHLVAGYTIDRLDFAEIPQSIVWAVRSDGKLLGLTYLPEQDVWGWHRHDTGFSTGAYFEDVCVVPEGNEDAVYVIVRRTIGGATKRYVERFASRHVTDVALDAFFMDSYLAYDGRNTSSMTMTLTAANPFSNWATGQRLAVTSSAGYFTADDVGNVIVLRSGTDVVRVTIQEYTSSTIVAGIGDKDVPVSLRVVALSTWEKAVDEIAGLDHLQFESVAVLGDGNVFPRELVQGGMITIDRPCTLIRAGIPITADFETLDLDLLTSPIRDKRKHIHSVALLLEASRGGWVGPDADHLFELLPQNPTVYGEALELFTGLFEHNITTTWDEGARVFVRQTDPLPISILGIIPSVGVGG
jgi:hypothetical protein